MGFLSNVAGRIRDILRRDKEQTAIQFAKGSTSPSYPASGYDILQAYGYDVLSDYLRLEQDLLSRYVDYEEMDDYPEISSAVDIFADDASQPETQLNRSVWVTSPDHTIGQVLDDLFHRTLRMDEEIWEIARTVVKYGNDFEEILVSEDGVRGLNFLPPPTVRRIEGPRGELFGFVQDFKGRFGYSPAEFQEILATRSAQIQGGAKTGYGGLDKIAALEEWEVMHLRLRSKHRRSIYGYSVLESGRWIWKRLMLLEDAAMIYRLQRAPERYAFYVDVGDLPPAEALAYVNRVRQQYKKIKFFNPTCLTADTCITCLDGVDRSIGELAKDYADKTKTFGVFSYDLETGRVVPGKASGPRKTGEQVPIWRVVLDSGAAIRSTGNHPFLMRDGTYKAANTLESGDSLMPLYMSRGSEGTHGYWMYDEPSTGRREYVHRMVAEATYGTDVIGRDVHHRNENKNDNRPENLEPLTKSEHMKRHSENAIDSPENEARRADWRARNPDQVLRNVTNAAKIAADNYRARTADIRVKILEVITTHVVRDPLLVSEELVDRLNADEVFLRLYRSLPRVRKEKIDMVSLNNFFCKNGFKGIKDFKTQKCGEARWRNRTYGGVPIEGRSVLNHKVISITFVGYEDVYNLDVAEYHNFALTCGVFVHNTGKLDLKYNPIAQDEDFFVPVRKGVEGARIEVLGSPSWQHMDDVEYFRDKLFAALKVPKSYLGQEEGVARAILSSEDVRFARTVLRVQRELRNGLRKVCRVHLAALNIDPLSVEYNVNMTVPSAIFELAQIEVRAARADLAGRMQEFVSLYWILKNIYQMNDSDIETIITQRKEDAERNAMNQFASEAMAQKEASKIFPQEGQGGGEQPQLPAPGQGGEQPGAEPSTNSRQGERVAGGSRQRFSFGGRAPRSSHISERELFAGDREAEKRASDKLEGLLKKDHVLAGRISELGEMLSDLKSAMPRK